MTQAQNPPHYQQQQHHHHHHHHQQHHQQQQPHQEPAPVTTPLTPLPPLHQSHVPPHHPQHQPQPQPQPVLRSQAPQAHQRASLSKPIIMDPPASRKPSQAPQQQHGAMGFPSPTQDHAAINSKFVDDCTRMNFAIQQSLPEAVRRIVRDHWEKCLLGSEFHQAFVVSRLICFLSQQPPVFIPCFLSLFSSFSSLNSLSSNVYTPVNFLFFTIESPSLKFPLLLPSHIPTHPICPAGVSSTCENRPTSRRFLRLL
jgi:hypothetical protein